MLSLIHLYTSSHRYEKNEKIQYGGLQHQSENDTMHNRVNGTNLSKDDDGYQNI